MALAAILFHALATPFAAAPETLLEGRWRLVEQTYERGRADHADHENPLRLEFVPEGAGLAGRVRSGSATVAYAWPAFASGGRLLPVQTEAVDIDPSRGRATARYRVASPTDDLVMHVTEEYRLENGALVGTVKVTLTDGSRSRGGYTLHRRFEKEP